MVTLDRRLLESLAGVFTLSGKKDNDTGQKAE